MTRRAVEEAVGVSRRRMGVDCLDLLQFHWWDYGDAGYLDALKHLADLRDEGQIRHLALTNFDTERLRIIADHGIGVVSNQVQYSLVDRRPETRMAAFCHDHEITFLAYGTLLGGLLSEKYLGRAEPQRSELNTASLQKYKNMIDAWGGWTLFQELLAVLKDRRQAPGGRRQCRRPRPAVAGVIVGARLGVAQHLADNTRVFGFALDDDVALIEAVLAKSRDLMAVSAIAATNIADKRHSVVHGKGDRIISATERNGEIGHGNRCEHDSLVTIDRELSAELRDHFRLSREYL